jgi:predicted metal-dependent enzyme (double-stranded beta helix superfamily)
MRAHDRDATSPPRFDEQLHGSYSTAATAILARGTGTPIHDHVTWRVFGVIQGVECEELFELDRAGTCLVEAGHRVNRTGAVSGFAPPGDIHRVRNAGDITATSIHIYGTDALALIRCEALEYAPESGSRTVAPTRARALDRAA